MYTIKLNEAQFTNLKLLLDMAVKSQGLSGNTDLAAREILNQVKKNQPKPVPNEGEDKLKGKKGK